MIKISIKDAQIGMVAAEPIKTPLGQILALPGTPLTRQLINKMKLYKVGSISIQNPSYAVAPQAGENTAKRDKVKPVPKTRAHEMVTNIQRVQASEEFLGFQLKYLTCINQIKDTFGKICAGEKSFDEAALLTAVIDLSSSCGTTIETFDMLNMRTIADPLYSHCLNVGLITRMIGRWLHMEKTDVNTLTIAGVLHDIGKCKIPDDVLNKPDKLTDEEFALIKKHPQFGFDLIRDLQIDSRIKRTALMHHERCDGSGYPSQLDSSLIDDFAMITAIADVYDAMTAARRYRAPLCPFAVISSFESEGFTKYNTKFLLLFLKKLATTYQSNRVMLNDSRFCNIVMLNPHELSRPIVRFDDGSILDLSTNREFFIKSVM
jgi:putative nucleotidyltransferase with HDIG domain